MKLRGLLVVGAAVAAIVAAVVLWPEGETAPAASAPRAPEPLLPPLEFGAEPLWRGPTDVQDVEADDDAVLFQHSDMSLTLADAATGTTRWTLEKMHDLGGVGLIQTRNGGPGERHLVAGGVLAEYYYTADCQYPDKPPGSRGVCHGGPDDEAGLALLSAQDGSVVWRTPVVTSYPAAGTPVESRPEQILRAANDDVAVVTVTNGMVDSYYASGTQRTVAVDVRTGKVRWDGAKGVWPMWIAGDTLLGVVSPALPDDGIAGTVVAIDLATGEKRWERQAAALVTVAGDVALVRGGGELAVVETGTGAEVGTFDDVKSACRSDHRTVIACAAPLDSSALHNHLTTFEVGSRKFRTSERDVRELVAVWDGGRIVVLHLTSDSERTYSVDVNGTVVDEELDPSVRPVTGRLAIASPSDDGPCELYEVLS
jgi:outer membrane protein assembly factor BamB